jgi:RNA polymerase sigma-70 factor, ECF subfamily
LCGIPSSMSRMSAQPHRRVLGQAPNSNGPPVYGVRTGKRSHLHLTTRTLTPRRGAGRSHRHQDASVPGVGEGNARVDAKSGSTLATESDAALVARVRAGDVAAFSGLVHRHMRSAFGIAYHVLQHREDAEDAVQQAFMAALARLDTFDATRPFGPWIARVVLNHARSARRARTRLVRSWVEPIETIEAGPSTAPDRAAERGEIRERVRAALELLPERQRLAVQLIDIEGYGPADVAAVLELSPVTVRWHLMAARRKLRRLLAPLGGPGSRSAREGDESVASEPAQHSTGDAYRAAPGQSDDER